MFELLPHYELGYLPYQLKGKLLRIKKAARGIAQTSQCWATYQLTFCPRLGSDLVLDYQPAHLGYGMHELCAIELMRAEEDGRRPDDRKRSMIDGVSLPDQSSDFPRVCEMKFNWS